MGRNANGNGIGALSPNIPIEIQRVIRELQSQVQQLSIQVNTLQGQVQGKLGNNTTDIKEASSQIRDNLQANGSSPLSITKLPGVASQAQPSAPPSSTALGGVMSYTAPPHQWLNAVTTSGSILSSQPSAGDISGLGPGATAATGNLVESTSSVLVITGGTGAVLGSGTSIQVERAAAGTSGYLSSADWSTFNGKQAALGYSPLNPANNLSELTNVAAARTNLGLGSAAAQNTSAFDPAGAYASWAANVAANAYNLSGVGILAAAGLQVSAFLACSGALTYEPGAATYMTGANASGGAWNEFSYYLNSGSSLANDEFWISVNTRTSSGGSDNYLPAIRVRALTGTVTFPNTVTFTAAPVFSDQADTRTALGLGTAATANSSSFATLSAANTFTTIGTTSFDGPIVSVGQATVNNSAAGANVVIQTTYATGMANIQFGANGTWFYMQNVGGASTPNNRFALYNNYGQEYFTMLQSGNVGIANSNPANTLDVGGVVNASSYKVGGTAGVSGTVTIPKITAANGSITIVNGIITAFTNPT